MWGKLLLFLLLGMAVVGIVAANKPSEADLRQAIRDKASDIHLEPFENEFKIRYRVDGVLYELEAPPPHLAVALIARVKVMADLDIAETRLPQDGRIELTIAAEVDPISATAAKISPSVRVRR